MWCSGKSLQNNDLRWMIHTTLNLIHLKSDMKFLRKPCHVDILRDIVRVGFRFNEVGIDKQWEHAQLGIQLEPVAYNCGISLWFRNQKHQ